MDENTVKRIVVEWLDDNYHFGDAAALIGGDEDKSFLQSGILDSLGFVKLILHIEQTFSVELDRKNILPANFDSLQRIATYVVSLPGARLSP
jgi:acyl carrier protein